MARTLADMTPEERQACVGLWCDLETNKGTQQVVLYKMVEEHITGPVAYRLSFTSRHEILGFDPKYLTPRFDLMRAWNPDGTPVATTEETAKRIEDTNPDTYALKMHRRFVTEWEVTDE